MTDTGLTSPVLRHLVTAISPASAAHAEGARLRVAGAGAAVLARLAVAMAGAQHTAAVRVARRTLVVVAGDHGAGDPGVALGADHPTVQAARAIALGAAPLAAVARTTTTPIAVVDACLAERAHAPRDAIDLGFLPAADLTRGPAMTAAVAERGLEAGVALALALAEPAGGLDVLGLGAIGLGAELASAALLGAVTGAAPAGLGDAGAEVAGRLGAARAGASPLDQLAALGGPDLAVLAGLVLGAASLDAVVLLDGEAACAAAAVACALVPAARGALVGCHRGGPTTAALLAHLGLTPVFDVGVGHGDGTAAAMTLPLALQVAALTAAP